MSRGPRVATLDPDWSSFRAVARELLDEGVAPDAVQWVERGGAGEAQQLGLLGDGGDEGAEGRRTRPRGALRVPRRLLDLGEAAACHRDPAPWSWLFAVLWRVVRGDRWLLDDDADPDMAVLRSMERAVRRDAHKMTAFVRFRSVGKGSEERFVAWFEPRHRIVRRTAPFFERRFPSMRWSILTPDECVHWNGEALSFSPGVARATVPDDDLERFWLTYYAHTFNPARVRISAMRAEMPVHYWKNLPEAVSITSLVREAPARMRDMIERARPAAGGAAPMPINPVDLVPAAASPAGVADGGCDPGGSALRPTRVRFGTEELGHTSPTSPARVAVVHPIGRRSEAESSGADRGAEPNGVATIVREAASRAHVGPRIDRLEPPADIQPLRIPGVRIGVAGWDYPDWGGRVYPAERAGVDRLRWVARRFDLVEVNSTFYRPAAERVTRSWLERTADLPDFRFAAKLSRVFTHQRGAWSEAEVAAVRRGMDPLLEAGRLISLVVQFPWSFRDSPDGRRHLARIADAFAAYPLHVEVRHSSWSISPLHNWLAERGMGVVNIDQPIFRDSIEPAALTTSSIAYVRLHGRNAENWFREDATRDERYDYSYSDLELRPWIERVREMARQEAVEEVEVVFNNHYRAQAVNNAEAFAGILVREVGAGGGASSGGTGSRKGR